MKWVTMVGALLVASAARAEDEAQPPKKEPLPSVFFNMGGGYAGPPMPKVLVDAKAPSVGQILLGDLHVFPFAALRQLGFVARVDATVLSTDKFLASSAPAIFSVTGGPELQTRTGSLIVRGGVLGGMRTWSDGVSTFVDPRVLLTMQADVVLGRGSDFAPVGGFFAGIDVYPGLGWSLGATVSLAMF